MTVYDFYFKRSLEIFKSFSLQKQLELLRNHKILVLDYCGIICKVFNIFPPSADIYLMENEYESFNFSDQYDIIYVLTRKFQSLFVEYNCINIEFTNQDIYTIK
ncbi:hypothetical protein NUSPORA_00044 [Nucleospora cyclopteri]